jgi:hypothetical protein
VTVNKLHLDVALSSAIFTEGKLYVFPPDFEHPGFDLGGKQLSFDFNSEDIKEINRGPFIPDINIKFLPGAEIKIPRDIGVTRIGFSANIAYKYDLFVEGME